MANVAVNTLVQDIIADIPEIPVFIAARQYIRALRELCEKARVWRINDTFTVSSSLVLTDISALFPDDTELVDIVSMKPAGGETEVKPTTYARLDKNEANWRSESSLVAKQYILESNNVLRLVPSPSNNVVDAYYIRMAIKPTQATQNIESLLVNKYSELLISGAKAYLFMVPRKPWTDLQLAQFHMAQFLGGIPAARAEATDEFQTGVARTVKYGGL